MTILQRNRKAGRSFPMSGMLFGFSMSRIATCVMRIVWATRPHNIRIAIAAQIFYNAGVLLIYLINLVLAQRLLRSLQPALGWQPWVSKAFRVICALVIGSLIMLITTVVLSFYTLNEDTIKACLDCQRAAQTYFFVLTFLPLVLTALASLLPHPTQREPETFGSGSTRSRVMILVLVTLLTLVLSGFKLGTTWSTRRPISDPAWYDKSAAFYCFGFVVEVLVLTIFIAARVDRRFYVPDGSSKRKSYVEPNKAIEEVHKKDSSSSSDSV